MADSPSAPNSGEQSEASRPCHKCKKTDMDLSRCERCEVLYCSRGCQVLDWKRHKKTCARSREKATSALSSSSSARAAPPAPSTTSSSSSARAAPPTSGNTSGLQQHISDPFTRIDSGTYLRDRPEDDVYKLLIDTYRLRMDDNAKFDNIREADSLYAAGAKSVLPVWWNDEKQAACEALGGASGWSSLRRKIDKAAVQTQYRNDRFPMQLRMFGEVIWGRGPGGQDGTTMRRLMMQQETGGSGTPHMMHMDAGGLFDRFRQQFG